MQLIEICNISKDTMSYIIDEQGHLIDLDIDHH